MTFSMAMVGSELFVAGVGLAALCSKVNSGACSCARRSSLTATLRARRNVLRACAQQVALIYLMSTRKKTCPLARWAAPCESCAAMTQRNCPPAGP